MLSLLEAEVLRQRIDYSHKFFCRVSNEVADEVGDFCRALISAERSMKKKKKRKKEKKSAFEQNTMS